MTAARRDQLAGVGVLLAILGVGWEFGVAWAAIIAGSLFVLVAVGLTLRAG